MIYLDNAATSRPNKKAVQSAEKFIFENFYNPSSIYNQAFNCRKEIDDSRKNLLNLLKCANKYSLAFTSGGSESNNLALQNAQKNGNIIISAAEHSSVYNTVKAILPEKNLKLKIADVDSGGCVVIDKLLTLIDENTKFVSVVHICNETGGINDINLIAEKIKRINKNIIFHSDGVQAFTKINYRLSTNVDLYSISAHKIGGMKGSGALVYNSRLTLKSLMFGGGQELGLRSGTENVHGIKVFDYAAQIQELDKIDTFTKIKQLNKYFTENLNPELFTILSDKNASPYILSVSCKVIKSEIFLRLLQDQNILISAGSACSSKNKHSRVISACGYSNNILDGVIRVSFSAENTMEEIKKAVNLFNETANKFSAK